MEEERVAAHAQPLAPSMAVATDDANERGDFAGRGSRPVGAQPYQRGQHRPHQLREITMAGMIRKLLVSGVATKLIQEARKPQNQAKIKKAIADFQAKRNGGGQTRRRTY